MHPFLSALCTSLLLVTAVANAADNAMLAERHTKREAWPARVATSNPPMTNRR